MIEGHQGPCDIWSFRWVMGIGAVLAFASALCAALMIKPGATASSEPAKA